MRYRSTGSKDLTAQICVQILFPAADNLWRRRGLSSTGGLVRCRGRLRSGYSRARLPSQFPRSNQVSVDYGKFDRELWCREKNGILSNFSIAIAIRIERAQITSAN